MRPLVKTDNVPLRRSQVKAHAKTFGMTPKRLKKLRRKWDREEEVWLNDLYVVHKRDAGEWIELSIRRQDREPITDWRHKQAIKNQLVGPEHEGLELFPAESRLIDTANQFWMWVRKDPEDRIPVGFNEGRKIINEGSGGSVQRPLEKA